MVGVSFGVFWMEWFGLQGNHAMESHSDYGFSLAEASMLRDDRRDDRRDRKKKHEV